MVVKEVDTTVNTPRIHHLEPSDVAKQVRTNPAAQIAIQPLNGIASRLFWWK
jgi:hypothetical protein